MSRSVTLIRNCLLFTVALACWPAARGETCSAPPEVVVDPSKGPSADAYANLGNWYADHHQFDCAIDAFRSARKLEPGSAHIRYLLGLSLYMEGRLSEAAEPLQTRGIVVLERGRFRVRERNVLRYYARTIEHLLMTSGRTH